MRKVQELYRDLRATQRQYIDSICDREEAYWEWLDAIESDASDWEAAYNNWHDLALLSRHLQTRVAEKEEAIQMEVGRLLQLSQIKELAG